MLTFDISGSSHGESGNSWRSSFFAIFCGINPDWRSRFQSISVYLILVFLLDLAYPHQGWSPGGNAPLIYDNLENFFGPWNTRHFGGLLQKSSIIFEVFHNWSTFFEVFLAYQDLQRSSISSSLDFSKIEDLIFSPFYIFELSSEL